ncbi:hypothetical protein BPAE_0273g00050 [Botrytis paeoniae]|uniref:Uncharacterized protein n=1 Tax=Botrytis paeoniae TaxID=278948 RepID=A0A4Z1FGE6_9HELO|nr:hypothetical protein BPAE_0273g00050 [Botrytis paeoniae]
MANLIFLSSSTCGVYVVRFCKATTQLLNYPKGSTPPESYFSPPFPPPKISSLKHDVFILSSILAEVTGPSFMILELKQ